MCQGLLTGAGNMLKNHHAVTKNSLFEPHADLNPVAGTSGQNAIYGIYCSILAPDAIDHERIRNLSKLVQQYYGHPPDCYLLVELGHKGRVDARLFADEALSHPMPLNMQEDGNPVVTNE